MLVSGVVYQYKGKMPDRPADSNAVEAEVYLSSGSTTMGPTSFSCSSNFQMRRRKRRPALVGRRRMLHDLAGAGSAHEPRAGKAWRAQLARSRP